MTDTSLFGAFSGRSGNGPRAVIVVAALALHVVVLAVLGLGRYPMTDWSPPFDGYSEPMVELLPMLPVPGRPIFDDFPTSRPPDGRPQSRPNGNANDRTTSTPPLTAMAPIDFPASAVAQDPWRLQSEPAAAIARSLRNGALGCRLGRSDVGDPGHCDQALAGTMAGAAPISGTGNPARDARLAAEGAAALANYERRRAPLKPYSRAEPCPGGEDLMGRCPPISIQGRIWSNRDGWLPDLPGRH